MRALGFRVWGVECSCWLGFEINSPDISKRAAGTVVSQTPSTGKLQSEAMFGGSPY